MILTMINTHKAYKALQDAGVADRQAEVMVEIFADMQQENALTKFDLSQATESLIRAQSATNNRLDALEGRLDQFQNEVKLQFHGVNQRFEVLEKSIDERFDVLEKSIDERFEVLGKSIDERFDVLEKSIDERFDKVDKRFDKIDERFARIDEKFEKIDEKFAKIDEKFEIIDEKFAKIDEKFEKIDERFNQQDIKINALDQRMQIGFTELKQDNIWIRRVLLTIATALIAITTKYLLNS
jgi:archaellum component FlaC